ncbi:MAG: hypothetical protein HOH33_15975 [Verrucomicrobia bacterium]|jgi:hypothetical protein|nr:hypothetical protein [Verrucomicrobiota bacterium]
MVRLTPILKNPLQAILLAVFCSTAFPAIASDAELFFPIGIYGAKNVDDLEIVKEAGFNCVVGPANAAFLDKAHELGLRVMASPGSSSGNSFDATRLLEKVKSFDAHPALWSWYLVDEPDMHRTPPWKVAMDQRMLKAVPAKSPVSLVLYNGANADDYGDIPDILMVDHYPIPWMPLAHFAQHMSWARHSVPDDKPVIAVMQAFDWYHFRNLLPGETHFRAPTFDELQCMTFMSLGQGMNGIIYYTLRSGEWDLLKQPDVWSGLQQAIRSVKENDYLLTSKRLWWRPRSEILPYEFRKNAALEPSISITLFEDLDGIQHVLLINTTPHSLNLKLQLPGASNRWASVFQKDTPFGGFKPETIYHIPFESYQVRLLKGFTLGVSPNY